MLDLDYTEAKLCRSDDGCELCGRARLVIAALRAVLDTTVEEVMRAPWPEDFLVGVDPHLDPGRISIMWTLAYLKRKAGVTS